MSPDLNGLDIGETVFLTMKTKDQLHVIYKNVAMIREGQKNNKKDKIF